MCASQRRFDPKFLGIIGPEDFPRTTGLPGGSFRGLRFYGGSIMAKRIPLADRFWLKVDKSGESGACWLWTARPTTNGYGNIKSGGKRGKMLLAHRVSWELHNGPIPPELQVLHKCDVRPCVNPSHLFLGTNADNVRDKIMKGRAPSNSGTSNPRAKLTEVQVIEIRALASVSSQRMLAEQFGIAPATVYNILHKHTWRNLP